MIARTRSTVSTRRRLSAILVLIEALGDGEMDLDAVCDLLHISPSGARKYIVELRATGVIEIARYVNGTATYIGKAMFRLALAPEKVAAFLAQLRADVTPPSTPARQTFRRPITPVELGRSFHILRDDSHYPVRVSRVVVARAPLVAAFFGPAAGEAYP